MHAMLRRQGRRVGRKRVERLMRDAGLQGAFLRKKWRIPSTRSNPKATPAPDLVNRQFTAAAPNRLWVADATRIPCGEGVFWLAAVRDVFSNRIVGWRCSDRCDTDLILGALEYGIWSRDVRDGQLIHHSDRGSNYTSFRFAQRLADNGILPSMGSVGDSYDNALMENFWSTLKIELVYRNSWRTRDEAENAIFTYIDGWYNTHRIQKDLGWRSPDEYEPPGTPTRHNTTRRLSFSLSPPVPGNQPSGRPGEPHNRGSEDMDGGGRTVLGTTGRPRMPRPVGGVSGCAARPCRTQATDDANQPRDTKPVNGVRPATTARWYPPALSACGARLGLRRSP
ncbi:IS3 family transposase [Micromonospora echinaurantiaca]|uniref:IS3 family transposase n=1 Tax=Micromonospora echinaurantiaca TaxID=47857 RepID=UPI0037ABE995